jgi:hypothetical protein
VIIFGEAEIVGDRKPYLQELIKNIVPIPFAHSGKPEMS